MATKKQKTAAKKNIQKAQAAWKGMTKRQHALAQPEGRMRKKPGTGGAGKFYHIGIRPKSGFTAGTPGDSVVLGRLDTTWVAYMWYEREV